MDLKKFEINLKKVNTLKQNIDISGEEISKLEIQLLKNYIQKMYEGLSLDVDDHFEEEEFEMIRKKKGQIKGEAVVKREPEQAVVVDEPVEEVSEEKVEEVVPVKTEEQEAEQVKYDEALLALFEIDNSSELSDKLGSLPIQDIKKTIGLNDRIFTINELFGGDKELFNETIDILNEVENFEGARDYLLVNIAAKYDWAKNDNIKKAKRFIKIVRRRFS